jgi:DNA-binding PadR family transcriptional regulator
VAGIITDSLGRRWDPNKHPRDRKGRFIRTFHKVRLFNTGGTKPWGVGRVDKINDEGHIDIEVTALARNNPESAEHRVGEKYSAQAANLESVNEKASLTGVKDAWNNLLEEIKKALGFTDSDDQDWYRVATNLANARGSYRTGGLRGPDRQLPKTDLDARAQAIDDDPDKYRVYIASLSGVGVDPYTFDPNAPDGLPALQPLIDKQNETNPAPNGWEEVLPVSLDREFKPTGKKQGGKRGVLRLDDDGESGYFEEDPDGNFVELDVDSFEDMFTDEEGTEDEEPKADLSPETPAEPTRNYTEDEFLAALEELYDDDETVLEDGEVQELIPGYIIEKPPGSKDSTVTSADGEEIVKIPDTADAERLQAAAAKIHAHQQETSPEDEPEAEAPVEEPAPEPETPVEEAPAEEEPEITGTVQERFDAMSETSRNWLVEQGFTDFDSVHEDAIPGPVTGDLLDAGFIEKREDRKDSYRLTEDGQEAFEAELVRRAEPELEEERAERNPTDEDPTQSGAGGEEPPEDGPLSWDTLTDKQYALISGDGLHTPPDDVSPELEELEDEGLVEIDRHFVGEDHYEGFNVTLTAKGEEERKNLLHEMGATNLLDIADLTDEELDTEIARLEGLDPNRESANDYTRRTEAARLRQAIERRDGGTPEPEAVPEPGPEPTPDEDGPDGDFPQYDLDTPEGREAEWKDVSRAILEDIGLTDEEVKNNFPHVTAAEASNIADATSAIHNAIERGDFIGDDVTGTREILRDDLDRDEDPWVSLKSIIEEGEDLFVAPQSNESRLDEIEEELGEAYEQLKSSPAGQRDSIRDKIDNLLEERDGLLPEGGDTRGDWAELDQAISDYQNAPSDEARVEAATEAIDWITTVIRDDDGNLAGLRRETKEAYIDRYRKRDEAESNAKWHHDPEEFPVIEAWLLEDGKNPKNPALNKFMVDEKGPYRYIQRGHQSGQKVHIGDKVAVKFKQGKKTGLWYGTVSGFFGDSGNGGKIEIQFAIPKDKNDENGWPSPSGRGKGTIDYDNVFAADGLDPAYESGRVLEPEIRAPEGLSIRDQIDHFLDSWIGADNQDRFSRLDGNEKLIFSNGYYLQAREDGDPLILTLHAPDGRIVDEMIDVPGYQEKTVKRVNDTQEGNPTHKFTDSARFIDGVEKIINDDEQNPGQPPAPEPDPEPEAPAPPTPEPEAPASAPEGVLSDQQLRELPIGAVVLDENGFHWKKRDEDLWTDRDDESYGRTDTTEIASFNPTLDELPESGGVVPAPTAQDGNRPAPVEKSPVIQNPASPAHAARLNSVFAGLTYFSTPEDIEIALHELSVIAHEADDSDTEFMLDKIAAAFTLDRAKLGEQYARIYRGTDPGADKGNSSNVRDIDSVVPDPGNIGPKPDLPPPATSPLNPQQQSAYKEQIQKWQDWVKKHRAMIWRMKAIENEDIFAPGPTLPVGDPELANSGANVWNPVNHHNNCYNCVTAWILRMKGYDVTANSSDDTNNKGLNNVQILKRWWGMDADDIQRYRGPGRKRRDIWEAEFKQHLLDSAEPGAYGVVSITAKGKDASGHVFIWYIDEDGVVHFYEPQKGYEYGVNSPGNTLWEAHLSPSLPVEYFRLDDIPLPTGEGVTSNVTAGGPSA